MILFNAIIDSLCHMTLVIIFDYLFTVYFNHTIKSIFDLPMFKNNPSNLCFFYLQSNFRLNDQLDHITKKQRYGLD